jgi:hypothetical protein
VAVRGRTLALAVVLAASISGANAIAQTLYKWTDKDGRVQYADKPPVNFKGEVTKIETDPAPPPAPPAAKALARPDAEADDKAKASDIGSRRRADRERLGARLAAARARLEKARAELAAGENALDEEKQIVQQHHPRDARGRTPAPRQNCMSEKAADGRPLWNCPTPIPNESFYTRQKALEEAVQQAEEEVAEAERAYRRGVD